MKKYLQVFFVALVSVVLASVTVAGTTYAGTTISTDILTGGTLTVTGFSSLNGQASTTQLTSEKLYVGTTGLSTILGNLGTSTFSGGIDLGSGCFAVSGTCLTPGGGSGLISLNGLTGSSQTFATGTDTNVTLTISSSGSAHTVTPGWTGSLAVTRGGTGLTSVTDDSLFIGGPSNTVLQIATSSLGLLTTNVAEGSNLYFTDARARTAAGGYFAATTSANTWNGIQTFTNPLSVSSGTSTFSGGIVANCFSIDGTTCLSSGGSASAAGGTGAVQFANGTSFAADVANFNWDNTNKRLGIATATPAATFAVTGTTLLNGNLTVTGGAILSGSLQLNGATTTAAGGVNLTSGCFAVGNTCLSSVSGVSSVSNSDGTLTILPTTGTVAATLNLGHANTWTGVQTFNAFTILGGQASTTRLSATDRLYVGSIGTTTIFGDLATSTFSGGINLSSGGCFAIGSTCIGGSGGGSGTVNSGTLGHIAYFAGGGTAISGTSTVFIATSSFVGIGTTSPSQALSVSGKVYTTGGIEFDDGSLQTAAAASASAGTAGQAALYATNGSTISGTSTLFIATNSFVGIGTTTPAYKLTIHSANGTDHLFQVATTTNQGIMVINSQGNVGIGTTSPSATLAVNGSVNVSGNLTLANSSNAISSIVFGSCNITSLSSIASSTVAYFDCTTSASVTTSHRVFVQATSSLPSTLIIQAASSTANGTINLRIYNASTSASTASGAIGINFFGIR